MPSGFSTHLRYRETRPFLDFKGQLFKPGEKVGEIRQYSNGNLVNTINRISVGQKANYFIDRCWDQVNPASRGKQGHITFRQGGSLAIIHVSAPGSIWTKTMKVSNIGKPGITTANRTEYVGRFCISIFDEIDQPHYGTAGGLNIDLNPFFQPITPKEESAAWNIRPKLEKYGLAPALFELREMPSLLEHTARTLRNTWGAITGNFGGVRMLARESTDTFLASEFGWKPFLSDVYKMFDTLIAQKAFLDQLIKQNNTWVKRARILGETETVTHSATLLGHGIQPSFGDIGLSNLLVVNPQTGSVGDRTIRRVVSTKTWAVGAFKFYRPELDPMRDDMFSIAMQARRVILAHGLRINPSHIWQIIPWSWLIDWFTNFGDIIARTDEAFNDGMVAKYLYVMKQVETSVVQQHDYNFYSGPIHLTGERRVSTKLRRVADNPYSFAAGVDLSQRQLEIIGALGMGRSKNFVRTM